MSDIPIPARLASRPRQGGLPILYTSFVAADGVADFRVNDPYRTYDVFRLNLCAMCGGDLRYPVFLAGPAVKDSRITPEPPGHEECLRYAVAVCPYLSRRKARSERPDVPGVIEIVQAPTLPEPSWMAWSPLYKIFLSGGVWYAVCRPWTRLEMI